MNYIIRDYYEEDYNQVAKVLGYSFHAKFRKLFKYEEDELVDFLTHIEFFPKHQAEGYFVAEVDGQIVAAINLNWRKLKSRDDFDLNTLRKKYGHRKVFKVVIAAITLFDLIDKDECYIESIATLPEYRGMGIGTALLEKADTFALEKGFRKLSLHVADTNDVAEKLYKSEGFRTRQILKSTLLKWILDEKTFKFMSKKPGDNPDKLTIGMFTDTYTPQINGVATSIHILTKELEKMGHTVYIITIQSQGLKTDFDGQILRIPGVKILKGTDYKLANIMISPKTENILENMHLDIIHTHTEFSVGLLGTFIAKRFKTPQVHTYHTMYDEYIQSATNLKSFRLIGKEVIKLYVREFADDCQKIIVPTEKTEKVLLDYKIKTPLQIVPTGIDFSKFTVDPNHEQVKVIKESLGIKENDFVCLNIGRLSKEKNTKAIIENVITIIPQYPQIKLVVIGDGPEIKSLRKMCVDYPDNIFIIGRVPWEDIAYYYQIGQAFITASRFETQGLTVIEALSSEVPVICTDDKAFIDIVKPSYNGLLFSQDYQIKDCILQMLDKDFYKSLKVNTNKSVIHYSSEYFSETVLNLYTDIVNNYQV